jgi:hypothetical protein
MIRSVHIFVRDPPVCACAPSGTLYTTQTRSQEYRGRLDVLWAGQITKA